MAAETPTPGSPVSPQLVIITGMSGSGKGTVLKTLEDLGYYAVDNLPIELIPKFAELTEDSPKIRRAALVVDIRAGGLERFPQLYLEISRTVPSKLIYLEADEATLMRRFSETRRPHPLGTGETVAESLRREKELLEAVRALADHCIDTSKFNVHELREMIGERFGADRGQASLMIYVNSFGYRYGVPEDSDLVFDVRFLPNPNYVPSLKKYTGKHGKVADYIRSFPQTMEFLERIKSLLLFLLPYYIEEGKSYLTISFGCTGGHHRSVMMAEEILLFLNEMGYTAKGEHRDIGRE